MIGPGSPRQCTAVGSYSDGTTAVINALVAWISSDVRVATIDSAGVANAVASGSVTITALRGQLSDTASLIVIVDQIERITVTPTSAGIFVGGKTGTAALTVTP